LGRTDIYRDWNKFIGSREAAKAEKRFGRAQGLKFLAKMRVDFHKSSLEAGKMDRFCYILIGVVAIILGVFLLFHPNGW
jgi:hypothetical protein